MPDLLRFRIGYPSVEETLAILISAVYYRWMELHLHPWVELPFRSQLLRKWIHFSFRFLYTSGRSELWLIRGCDD